MALPPLPASQRPHPVVFDVEYPEHLSRWKIFVKWIVAFPHYLVLWLLGTVAFILAFFAWYAALARGGVAKIGQVQLVQQLLTLGSAAALLGEHVGPATLGAALAVVACVVATQRARVGGAAPRTLRDPAPRTAAARPGIDFSR